MRVPLHELSWKYARSSGSGGQNVNKVSSKAILYWSPQRSLHIPDDVKERFIKKFGSKLSREGILQIQSERFRDQPRNVEDCIAKLEAMITSVWLPPRLRKKTKPSRSAKLQRLESKRRQSDKKRSRGWREEK